VQRAADVVTPGTTVHVAAGDYAEQVEITLSGTASQRIVFVSDSKWGANIHHDDTDQYGAIVHVTGDYVDVRGFDINGNTQVGIYMEGSYGSIVGNKVHGTGKNVDSSNGGAGIHVAGPNYDNHNVDIIGNLVYDIGEASRLVHGIYLAYPNGQVSNNIVHNVSGFGIHAWHAARDLTVSNNLVFHVDANGIGIGAGDGVSPYIANNFVVTNNISVYNGEYGLYEASDGVSRIGDHNLYYNNLVYGNAAGAKSLRSATYNTIAADPQFRSYQADGSGNYYLKPGSPGIDGGTATGAPATDYAGNPRPHGHYDIGPYENGSVGSCGSSSLDHHHALVRPVRGSVILAVFDSSSTVLAAPAEGKWRISAVFGELGSKIGQKCSATS
jgi:hypothetical protein